ncbi:hypothetical protein K432DRAFT_322587 [Lepidopterella palustris CBS 459.81]|uniref:Protein YOP1 n=1 Tax=Lepidopterella palustris CBS 459.81 TaxID=1314670 RepID=A0A8E2EGD8_9PEZI|nr:hypothetical protein K432DRAFT_322587 [Lepidopterella palustris CBS 459.81]
MFGIIADGLNTVFTVLFPVFASYKALHTSDPALLSPWLMYFVTLSLLHLLESSFDFILGWIPFYAWLRLILHLYLVMPGSQGASLIYREHIDPFLRQHEIEIDNFITNAHDRAKSAGLSYFKQAIEWAKVNVLGLPPRVPSPPPSRHASYTQTLMARFNMPSARTDTDFYGLVTQALSGATGSFGTREAQAEKLSASGTLIPPGIEGNEERLSYLATQKQRLMVLLQAFDREQVSLMDERDGGRYGEGGLAKSRSEAEFDRIERDELDRERPVGSRTQSQPAGWMPWTWGAKPKPVEPEDLAYGDSHGRSSGFDLGPQ